MFGNDVMKTHDELPIITKQLPVFIYTVSTLPYAIPKETCYFKSLSDQTLKFR